MDFEDDSGPQMVRLGKVDDFARGKWRGFRLLARPVGVFRGKDDSFRAMEMGCKHQNADLLEGHMRDNVVTCPWHGWKYDLGTGECLWGSKVCLRPHAVEVRGSEVFVSLRPVSD